jgi:hypothetical protein
MGYVFSTWFICSVWNGQSRFERIENDRHMTSLLSSDGGESMIFIKYFGNEHMLIDDLAINLLFKGLCPNTVV